MLREILLDYGLIFVWVIAILEVVFTLMLFADFNNKREPVVLLMALLGVGLCYDAVVLGFGGMVMLPLLSVASRIRFVLHGLLIPLNFAICAHAVPFYRTPLRLMWILTAGLMVLGAAAGCFREIEQAPELGNLVRFYPVSPDDFWAERVTTVLDYASVFIVIGIGIVLTVKQKAPSFLLAGLLMLVFSALGPVTGNADLIFLISMFGELFMLLFYLVYEKRHVV